MDPKKSSLPSESNSIEEKDNSSNKQPINFRKLSEFAANSMGVYYGDKNFCRHCNGTCTNKESHSRDYDD